MKTTRTNTEKSFDMMNFMLATLCHRMSAKRTTVGLQMITGSPYTTSESRFGLQFPSRSCAKAVRSGMKGCVLDQMLHVVVDPPHASLKSLEIGNV